jgi:hypothetical protein
MYNVNVLNEEVNRRMNLNEKMLEQKTMERKKLINMGDDLSLREVQVDVNSV